MNDQYTVPFTLPELPDGARWGHAPRHHNGDYIYPGRRVLLLDGRTWPHKPETCPAGDATEWQLGGQILVCPSCGLDES